MQDGVPTTVLEKSGQNVDAQSVLDSSAEEIEQRLQHLQADWQVRRR